MERHFHRNRHRAERSETAQIVQCAQYRFVGNDLHDHEMQNHRLRVGLIDQRQAVTLCKRFTERSVGIIDQLFLPFSVIIEQIDDIHPVPPGIFQRSGGKIHLEPDLMEFADRVVVGPAQIEFIRFSRFHPGGERFRNRNHLLRRSRPAPRQQQQCHARQNHLPKIPE